MARRFAQRRNRRTSRLAKALAATASVTCALGLAATGASAGTEFGGTCTGNIGVANATLLQLAQAPSSPLPLSAPVSGVITRWKLTSLPPPEPVPMMLKVFRPTADPRVFQTVGESAPGTLAGGENSYATQIPIEAGDRLGLYSTAMGPGVGTVYCSPGAPGDVLGAIKGNPSVGSPATVVDEGSGYALPARAVIEPDADRDGYGDESQDGCPQSASVHVGCPLLTLDAFGYAAKNAVSVLVATSSQAPVSVSGSVRLPAVKGARSSALATLAAPPRPVEPGSLAAFKLKFTKALKAALAALPRRKSLTLKVIASGPNAAGVVGSDTLAVKLRGRR